MLKAYNAVQPHIRGMEMNNLGIYSQFYYLRVLINNCNLLNQRSYFSTTQNNVVKVPSSKSELVSHLRLPVVI